MSQSYTRLKYVSAQLKWQSDAEILVLSGYITRIYPDLDSEKFANATIEYANNSGLSADIVTRLLCGLIDDAVTRQPDKTTNPFADYLAGVMAEYRKLNPQEEKPAEPINISVPADVTCEIDAALKSERPFTTTELGGVIVKSSAKVDEARMLYLDVINAEPTPALSITVAKNSKTEYHHRPIRLKQWNDMQPCAGGRHVLMKLPNDELDLTFWAK